MTEVSIYRNQSIDPLCKSMDWFLHDRDLHHERVKDFSFSICCQILNLCLTILWIPGVIGLTLGVIKHLVLFYGNLLASTEFFLLAIFKESRKIDTLSLFSLINNKEHISFILNCICICVEIIF